FMNNQYKANNGNPNGVILASGTAISNSIGEIYNMQRMLQPETMKRLGLHNFDAWLSTFGVIESVPEPSLTGTGFKIVTKIDHFDNVPELKKIAFQVMDLVNADDVGIVRPKVEGGKPTDVIIERNQYVEEYLETIEDRAANVEDHPGTAEYLGTPDNMLRIISDGRKIALDQRLLPQYANTELQEDSKINKAADNIVKRYKETKNIKGTQLVFCNLGIPKKFLKEVKFTAKEEEEIEAMTEKEKAKYDRDLVKYMEYVDGLSATDFNTYDELKRVLIKRGIPAHEIAYIMEYDDANKPKKLKELMRKVNKGDIRVVIGSAKRMGTGINVQERVVAMHHMDVWWNFSAYEQSNGRGRRKGNINEEIGIANYVTRGTVDSFMWDKVGSKGITIGQFMSRDMTTRSLSDVSEDTINAKMLAAIAADDPRRAEHAILEKRVRELTILRGHHIDEQYTSKKEIPLLGADNKRAQAEIERYDADAPIFKGVTALKVGDTIYRLDSGASILKLNKFLEEKNKTFNPALVKADQEVFANYYVGELGIYTIKEGKDKNGKKTEEEIFTAGSGKLRVSMKGSSYRADERTVNLLYSFEGGRKPYDVDFMKVKQGRKDDKSSWITASVSPMTHVDTALKELREHIDDSKEAMEKKIQSNNKNIAEYTENLAKPFQYEAELKEKEAQYKSLSKELIESSERQKEEKRARKAGKTWVAPKTNYYAKIDGDYVRVTGKPVVLPGFETLSFYLREDEDGRFAVHEVSTGLMLTDLEESEEEAVSAAQTRLDSAGEEKVKQAIANSLENGSKAPTDDTAPSFRKDTTYRMLPGEKHGTTPYKAANLQAVLAGTINKITKATGVTVKVIQNNYGFPVDFVERAGADFDIRNDRVYGAYDPRTDTVYLVADYTESVAAAERVIFEELVGHKGLPAFLGKEKTAELRAKVYSQFKGDPAMK
ncbi:MAG: helicase-related protein, partial [Sulfurimonas sp.]